MFVVVDRSRCTGLGICESIAPDTFEIADSGTMLLRRGEIPEDERARLGDAVLACPTEALRLTERRR